MLTLIYGKCGSGKSLLLTILAYYSRKKVLYTNFYLNLPKSHQKKIETFDMQMIYDDNFKNAKIFLDELYTIADSRNSMEVDAELLTYVAFQSRKNKLDIYLSTQLYSVFDIRFRELVDYNILCTKRKDLKAFKYIIKDGHDRKQKKFYITFKKAKQFYAFYNTLQIINSERINTKKFNSLSNDKNERAIELSKIIQDDLKEQNLKFTTKAKMKDYINFFLATNKINTNTKFTELIYLNLVFK